MSNTMYWETDTRKTRMVSGMQGNSNIFTLELIVLVINQVSLVMYKRFKFQTRFKFIYLAQPCENCL